MSREEPRTEDRNLGELRADIERLEARLAALEGSSASGLFGLLARMPARARPRLALAAALLAVATASYAATISMPHTFSNGTIADADEVNANFDTLVVESNDQDARLEAVENQLALNKQLIAANSAGIAANASDIGSLQSDVATNTGDIEAIDTTFAGVSRVGTLLTFSGMNVRGVDGSGNTSGAVNGLGNLIVGYNENSYSATRTGSHNLVVGVDNEYTSYGGLVAAYQNSVTNSYASVTGGQYNAASGAYSSVSGGHNRSVSTLHDWRAGSLSEDD